MSKARTFQMNAKDRRLWRKLPDDVVASVQARLPLVSLVRSRAVCKEWNAAVSSPWLLQERLESRGGERERMLCVMDWLDFDVACCVYDRASHRWYQLPLPPWLREIGEGISPSQHLRFPTVSAGGNVLVFAVQHQGPRESPRFVPHMGNPVAGSWTRLPVLPDHLMIGDVLGVFEDAKARSFKLVAMVKIQVDEDVDYPVHVFDSALGRWSAIPAPLPNPDLLNFVSGEGAFVGSVLYYVTGRGGYLLAYDMERAGWSWSKVARLRDFRIFYGDLINVRDRLMCVALCLNVPVRGTSVQILELDFARMAWTAVGAMPAPMYFSHFRKVCFRQGGFIFRFSDRIRVVAGQGSEVYIMHQKLDRLVVVDLRPKPAVWRWLPACPYKNNGGKRLFCLDPWLEY